MTIVNCVCMYCRDPVVEHNEDQLAMCMRLLDANEYSDLMDVDVEQSCPCGDGGNECDCWESMRELIVDEEDSTP